MKEPKAITTSLGSKILSDGLDVLRKIPYNRALSVVIGTHMPAAGLTASVGWR